MGWITLAIYAFQLVFKVWDAIHDHNEAKRAEKMEALKEGLDAIHSRDASSINLAITKFNRL